MCSRVVLWGLAVLAAVFWAPAHPVAGSGGDRVIRLHNVHSKETAEILYKRDGKFIKAGLEKASWLLRDWRRNEATEMDPALIDLLWEIHAELGSKEPIHIISGYRSRATNDMLRRTTGGQASESRHILGQAADVFFPDIPLKRLRYSALIRERGGVGYYPASGSPFVHVDTGRVRAWPRLPRAELALLFPDARTQHVPADGTPIKPEDVRIARVHQQDLAREIADYRANRRNPRDVELREAAALRTRPVVVASAIPPRLIQAPAPAARPAPARAFPGDTDRAGLARLAALAAGPEQALRALVPARLLAQDLPMVASLGPTVIPSPALVQPPAATAPGGEKATIPVLWVPSPAWDEDHPDELSYRPFAIAPLMSDDPREPAILTQLRAPDPIGALEYMDQAEFSPSARLVPKRQRVLPGTYVFRGPAVAVNDYFGSSSQ